MLGIDGGIVDCGKDKKLTSVSHHANKDWYVSRYPVRIDSHNILEYPNFVGTISYALIYNLALCHHLEAIALLSNSIESPASKPKAALCRAIAFYKQAQRIIRQDNLPIGVMPLLVIMNNLGHAFHLLSKDSSAKWCFHNLWSGMLSIPEDDRQRMDDELVGGGLDQLWDGFMVNIVRLVFGASDTENNAAPAA